jgi:integrase
MGLRKRGDAWQIDYFDPNGKRIRKSFKKKKDAEVELAKRVSLIAEGRYLDVKKECTTTFKQLCEKYSENYQHQVSFQNAKVHFLENFKRFFGEETRLENIRYMELETYKNHLRRTPTKKGTIRADASLNREIACLHHVFVKAVEWEMIERSAFHRGKSLLVKENNKRIRYLKEEEIEKLLDECPRHVRQIAVCAVNTGMRREEILSLKWSQVNNGFIYLQKTKTNEARQIPVNDALESLFFDIRKEHGLRSEYVFSFAKGEGRLKGPEPIKKREGPAPVPERVTNVRTAFQAALRRAGIENFRFHDLRHTFASHMIMRGASLKDLQEILGHKTMTMTLRYAHLTQEHKKKAVNLLNGLTACDRSSGDCHKSVTTNSVSLSVSG